MGMIDEVRAGHELFAKFETTEGVIVARLFSRETPKTVENFVGLATGEKEWIHPGTLEPMKNVPLYDGTLFHKCIKDFMVQGGDPLGRGSGTPGYRFDDELQSHRRFDRPGLLAMANSGANTNGCQFIITVIPTTWLNGQHTIFGEVVSGLEVVDRMANVIPKLPDPNGGPPSRPRVDVVLKKLTIMKAP